MTEFGIEFWSCSGGGKSKALEVPPFEFVTSG